MSKQEKQHLKKQCEDEEALKAIQAVYPQCANCLYPFKSQQVLTKHICSGVMESHDALGNAMRHANKLLAKMDFTVDGAIAQASHMFDRENTYATFEPNVYAVLFRIAGRLERLKILEKSAEGVFARLEELQLQHTIRLSELPLAGKIRIVYQSIGWKFQVQTFAGRKRGRHQEEGSSCVRQKKLRIPFEELDLVKDLSKWKKYELEVYLTHHHLKKQVSAGSKNTCMHLIIYLFV
ncbi:hypothetical protein EMCRGX_G025446 [Ephydatia muelleri]